MLYFHRRSKLGFRRATYNGRFTFVRGLSPEAATTYLESGSLSSFEDERVAAAAIHEKCHKSVFLHSEASLLIIGLRWYARIMGRVLGNWQYVRKYYRARTIYFLHSYSQHEILADELYDSVNDSLEPRNLDPNEIALLDKLDHQIFEHWKEEKVWWMFIPRMFLRRLGREYCSHFTFLASYKNKDLIKHRNIAESGIINDRNFIRDSEQTSFASQALKKLSKYLQVEYWAPQDKFRDWKWLVTKFRAEYEVLKDNNIPEEKIREYMVGILSFAAAWRGLDDCIFPKEVFERVYLTINEAALPPAKPEWVEDPNCRQVINFFSLHGN